ncbi:TlpA family protein disulfide reductase [Tsukamurella paurometabola]|uniref:TlpA family protein disulfide reductase n=1 Tax=Tsukamurella paurometabola TaxID=2061 RepID=UPI000F7F0E22|nr:TlpA disulfide reductase family protein [Tsukamurella paurometabola]UEA81544.1 TlpA family protein disulfide reductase [Tsukamurella paurometabola]
MSVALPPGPDECASTPPWHRRHRYALALIAIAAALLLIAVSTAHSHTEKPGDHDTASTGTRTGTEAPLQASSARGVPKPQCGGTKSVSARSVGPLADLSEPCLTTPDVINLGQLTAGRTTLLNFWASWCGTCREEMPILSRYAQRPEAVQVLGINVRDVESYARTFATDLALAYPSIIDADGAVARTLQIPPLLPLSFLVRPDGSVQRIVDPLVFRSVQDIEDAVARAQPSLPGK